MVSHPCRACRLGLSVGVILPSCRRHGPARPSEEPEPRMWREMPPWPCFMPSHSGPCARRARHCLLSLPRPIRGGSIPKALVERSRLDAMTLRRSEDAFVDELFAGVTGLGAPLIAARFPAPFAMPIAAPGELDAGMFSGPLSVAVDAPSPRVSAGLGVIPRIVRDGAEIYRGKL